MTSMTDPEGNITYFTSHDIMGNVLTKEDARGKVWTYEYDEADRLKTITDPLNNVTQLRLELDLANETLNQAEKDLTSSEKKLDDTEEELDDLQSRLLLVAIASLVAGMILVVIIFRIIGKK